MFQNTEILVPFESTTFFKEQMFFKETVSLLQNTGAKVIVLCDKTFTDLEVYRSFIKRPQFCEFRTDQPEGFWPKIRHAFNESTSRYLAICEIGALWTSGKLLTQLRTLRDYKAAICLSAYQKIKYKDNSMKEIIIQVPTRDFLYGCKNIPPSMWMLDHTKIKKLHVPLNESSSRTFLDPAVLMELCDLQPCIPVINIPLVTLQYNDYPIDKAALKLCHLYTRDMLSPRFQYITPTMPQCFHYSQGDRDLL